MAFMSVPRKVVSKGLGSKAGAYPHLLCQKEKPLKWLNSFTAGGKMSCLGSFPVQHGT
jgi:hypothetical protein